MMVAGKEVARIGLGTNRLASTPENHAFLREAVEAGLGMIDTAHVYTGGDSERTIGEALSPRPTDSSSPPRAATAGPARRCSARRSNIAWPASGPI